MNKIIAAAVLIDGLSPLRTGELRRLETSNSTGISGIMSDKDFLKCVKENKISFGKTI
jgi:hypothetical protein